MVYSTCSILKQENEECINEFIKNNEMFSIKQIDLKNDNYFKDFKIRQIFTIVPE